MLKLKGFLCCKKPIAIIFLLRNATQVKGLAKLLLISIHYRQLQEEFAGVAFCNAIFMHRRCQEGHG